MALYVSFRRDRLTFHNFRARDGRRGGEDGCGDTDLAGPRMEGGEGAPQSGGSRLRTCGFLSGDQGEMRAVRSQDGIVQSNHHEGPGKPNMHDQTMLDTLSLGLVVRDADALIIR